MDQFFPLDQSFTLPLDEDYELKRVKSLTAQTVDTETQKQNQTEDIQVSTNLENLQNKLENIIGNYLQDLACKPMKLSFSFDKMPMLDSQKLSNEKDQISTDSSYTYDKLDDCNIMKLSVISQQNNFVEQLTQQVINQLKSMQQNNQVQTTQIQISTPMSNSKANLDKLFEEMKSLNPEEQVIFLMRIINEQQEQISYWRKKALSNGMTFENFLQ